MKLKIPTIKSERLILRKMKLSDASDFLEMELNDRKLGKINTINKAKLWIKKCVNKDGFYLSIVLKNKVIGYIELCHLDWWDWNAGEICYYINKNYWRQGYATESSKALIDYCFTKLNFHKVYADTDPNNIASQKTLKKIGFKLEGKIRDRRIAKGNWTDELDYGLLRSEWKK